MPDESQIQTLKGFGLACHRVQTMFAKNGRLNFGCDVLTECLDLFSFY